MGLGFLASDVAFKIVLANGEVGQGRGSIHTSGSILFPHCGLAARLLEAPSFPPSHSWVSPFFSLPPLL